MGVGEFIFGNLEVLVEKRAGRWMGKRGKYLRLGCEFGSGCSERIGHRDCCRESKPMRNVLYKPTKIFSFNNRPTRFYFSAEAPKVVLPES